MFGPVDTIIMAMEQTLHDALDEALPAGMRYDPMSDSLVPIGLTRFDPSTKTRVPVTQEWVDEAVAEIVRLNQELTPMVGEYRADYSLPEQHQIDALNAECRTFLADHGLVPPSEADRIWEAVRAASAV